MAQPAVRARRQCLLLLLRLLLRLLLGLHHRVRLEPPPAARPALVVGKDVHVRRQDGPGDERAAARRLVDVGLARPVDDRAAVGLQRGRGHTTVRSRGGTPPKRGSMGGGSHLRLEEPHRPAVVGHHHAEAAVAVAVDARARAARHEVGRVRILGEAEELDVAARRGVARDQPVRRGRRARVLVGVEDVQLLVAVAVDVARRHADGAARGVAQRGAAEGDVDKGRAVPLERLVGRTVARDDKLEEAVAVRVGDGHTVVELRRVGGEERADVLEEAAGAARKRRRWRVVRVASAL